MSDEYLNKNLQIECNYVECKSITYEFNHGLSIFHLNARSFVHNFDEIIMLLDSIEIKFNIIVISETWLQEYNKDLYQIENYNACHITRNNSIKNTYNNNTGGGVSIFIQHHLNYNTIDNLCISKHKFVDILKISLNINNKNILISGLYKSPKADIIDFSDFVYIHYFSAIGCSHNACFACRTNKCWTEFFKIIDSVQHLLGFLFFSSYSKNRKYPTFCWTEISYYLW